MTPDNKYLFAGSYLGHLKQICLERREVVVDYGKIHGNRLRWLEVTSDSKQLITGGWDKIIKIVAIDQRRLSSDKGKVCYRGATRMRMTADDN